MNKKAPLKEAVSIITTLTDDQLIAEHERLKAGTVGEGFDKMFLPQAVGLVEKEMKARKLKKKEPLPHENPPK